MRQVIVLSALLGAALVGSYMTWTADEADTTKADQVMVYRADADDVQSLKWTHEGVTAVVERREDARGTYTWVTVTEEPKEPAGTDLDDPSASPETPEPKVVSFKGNEAADQLWTDFTPLYALRELHPEGGISDTAFGFDSPQGTLEVARKSGPLTLVLGGETYGAKDRYVKVDGRVFLLDDKTLRSLQYAQTRLVDRLVEPLGEGKTRTVELTANGQTVSFVHQNHDDPRAAFWARAESSGEEDAGGAGWIGKALRIRIQDYDVPADASGLESLFRYKVGDGSEAWSVEVLRSVGDDPQYYARGEYSRGLVHLTESLASEAFADLTAALPPATP